MRDLRKKLLVRHASPPLWPSAFDPVNWPGSLGKLVPPGTSLRTTSHVGMFNAPPRLKKNTQCAARSTAHASHANSDSARDPRPGSVCAHDERGPALDAAVLSTCGRRPWLPRLQLFFPRTTHEAACCALRAENVLVCCCCAGSDRAARGGVSRVRPSVQCATTRGHACGDGRPCSRLPRSVQSHDRHPVYDWQTDRSFLKTGSVPARCERQFVDGSRVFFSGARLRAPAGAIIEALSCTNFSLSQGHDPPNRQQEIVRGRASPAYSRRNPLPPTCVPRRLRHCC